jgi:hypothetical protein
MIGIKKRLLNKIFIVQRVGAGTVTSTGDLKDNIESVGWVMLRVLRNSALQSGYVIEPGRVTNSSHKGFGESGIDIMNGDFVIDFITNEIYWVDYVDKYPGGIPNHTEIDLSKTTSQKSVYEKVGISELEDDVEEGEWSAFIADGDGFFVLKIISSDSIISYKVDESDYVQAVGILDAANIEYVNINYENNEGIS